MWSSFYKWDLEFEISYRISLGKHTFSGVLLFPSFPAKNAFRLWGQVGHFASYSVPSFDSLGNSVQQEGMLIIKQLMAFPSESVKCRFSKCRFSVLNLKFDFISDGGCTREKQIQKALGSLPPCGNRCRFSESAICSSRVHPPSEIKSNFKFKTLRWRPLRWRLTLSDSRVPRVWIAQTESLDPGHPPTSCPPAVCSAETSSPKLPLWAACPFLTSCVLSPVLRASMIRKPPQLP